MHELENKLIALGSTFEEAAERYISVRFPNGRTYVREDSISIITIKLLFGGRFIYEHTTRCQQSRNIRECAYHDLVIWLAEDLCEDIYDLLKEGQQPDYIPTQNEILQGADARFRRMFPDSSSTSSSTSTGQSSRVPPEDKQSYLYLRCLVRNRPHNFATHEEGGRTVVTVDDHQASVPSQNFSSHSQAVAAACSNFMRATATPVNQEEFSSYLRARKRRKNAKQRLRRRQQSLPFFNRQQQHETPRSTPPVLQRVMRSFLERSSDRPREPQLFQNHWHMVHPSRQTSTHQQQFHWPS